MGKLISAYILPHPPIIVPEIGGGQEREAGKTIAGCQQVAKDIKEQNPDTIIVITPHGPIFKDAVGVFAEGHMEGSFKSFRRPDVKIGLENDLELAGIIIEQARKGGGTAAQLDSKLLEKFGIEHSLDHGALVPLYYILKGLNNFKIVYVSIGFLSFSELFQFGCSINRAIKESNRNVVVVASGDLSHRLTKDAPCGYDKRGREFDELFVKLLGEGNFKGIMDIDEDLIEGAGECGLRPFAILFGCLEGCMVKPEIISYEGPFGVGYCTAKLNAANIDTV